MTFAGMPGRLRRETGTTQHPAAFRRATEIQQPEYRRMFTERAKLRGPALIRFDGKRGFVAT
jgi:hypothetical protein